MSFPKVLERNENGLSEVLRPMKSSMQTNFHVSIAEEDSPIKPQMANRSDYEPYPEPGNNEDLKSPGYPDGPIAIYGDNVYLYLEPTAEEAARFDVVINVAREVKNPFNTTREEPPAALAASQSSCSEEASPIPDTAVTTASFATAFEFQPSDDRWVETPTTPKANPLQRPEYIHMEWDHNTDIAPDLKSLCETIDERTKEGKKVLVHCQQGASRSASLIIAYGLYQNPDLSVNDAYYAAQAKSRWISPNMKLMYSLQDFQKEISKRRTPLRSGRSPTKHRTTLSADAINLSAKEPQTAPLPSTDTEEQNKEEQRSPTRPRGNSTPLRPTAAAESASVPRNFEWRAPVEQSTPPPPMPTLSFVDLPQRPKSGQGRTESGSQIESWFKPPPTPGFNSHGSFGFQTMTFPSFRESISSVTNEQPADSPVIGRLPGAFPVEDEALMSPRAETMTNNPLHECSEVAGMRFVESPPTPVEGLFSPRVSMFPRDPFTPFGRPEQVADPRSPPTKGETPIVRSIDDILWWVMPLSQSSWAHSFTTTRPGYSQYSMTQSMHLQAFLITEKPLDTGIAMQPIPFLHQPLG
jgi:tyrosine-protein phosphatase